MFPKKMCCKCDIWGLQTDYADALPRFSQSSQSLRDGSHPYKDICCEHKSEKGKIDEKMNEEHFYYG